MNAKNISYQLYGITIKQRTFDGYINASQLCKAHYEKTGELKKPIQWLGNSSTKSIIEKLAEAEEVSVDSLVDVQKGKYGGTWIHPRLAVRFAMWLNDDFSLQVEDWVQQWMNWNISPVQLAVSELHELTEIVEVSIKATQMIHTAAHGLTAILNMAYSKLYDIQRNQAKTFASNDVYYKQVNKIEERIHELDKRVNKLFPETPEDFVLIKTDVVDVESKEMPKLPSEELIILQEHYEGIEEEGRLLEAKEKALLMPLISKVVVALGSFGQKYNKLEFQAMCEQHRRLITIYIYQWGEQVGCKTFKTWDYPSECITINQKSYKSYARHNFCNEIYKHFCGHYMETQRCNYMMRAIEEVYSNNYYGMINSSQNFTELEDAKKLLPDNKLHQSWVRCYDLDCDYNN